jgi:hypothetical protein
LNRRIAFAGTRGLPANYGGFETAVDEITRRFVKAGYACDVFCRHSYSKSMPIEHQGRRLIYMRGAASPRLETFASAVQTGWYLFKHRHQYDHVFWFNNANFPGILLGLIAGIPTTINTDGLEWKRRKWSLPFKAYYFFASWMICRIAPRLIADSIGIQNYYRSVFRRKTFLISYGIPDPINVPDSEQTEILSQFNLQAGKYFLQITRFEPDNLPLEIAQHFKNSNLYEQGYQFVAVGLRNETPYALMLKKKSEQQTGISVIPATYDPKILFTLRSNCFAYIHGNTVGGTNPALLEAMAVCPRILAIDVTFSHEILGGAGLYFSINKLANTFQLSIDLPDQSEVLKKRVSCYDWNSVAKSYQNIVERKAPNNIAI